MHSMSSTKKHVIVTLADQNYVEQAKQLFSSVYWNSGWKGDLLLLAHGIPEEKLSWFRRKGILVYECEPLSESAGTIGIRHHTRVVLAKFYLFKDYFRRWDKVIFLDGDIIVRSSLDGLIAVPGFAAPSATPHDLREEFHNTDPSLYRRLKQEHRLSGPAFNTGVFCFDTASIEEGAFDAACRLFERYQKLSRFADEGILNLLFRGRWLLLPDQYNVYPEPACYERSLKPHELQGVILHFVSSEKPWNRRSSFHREWLANYNKADQIDLSVRPEGKRYPPSAPENRKRILVISPVASHPQNSGNRARICSLLSDMRDLGWGIDFLYDGQEHGAGHVDRQANTYMMGQTWDRFFWTRPNIVQRSLDHGDRFLGVVGRRLKKIRPSVYARLKVFFPTKH